MNEGISRACICLLSLVGIFGAQALAQETTRVSVNSEGVEGDDGSLLGYPAASRISADGRYVAFWSVASNLVADDTNDIEDVFVHDRQTGETTRVSVDSDGVQGDNGSRWPSISADGRFVAFASWASNLVADDTNLQNDIFVHDRQTGETTRVSVYSDGSQATWPSEYPSLSADGRFVAFESWALVADDSNNCQDIYVHDRQTGETTRVSVSSDGLQANTSSWGPSISGDGRYVAFDSGASNLVVGDTNLLNEVFVHDRQTGETSRISVDSDGVQGDNFSTTASISADGRFVVFTSTASNLVAGDANGSQYDTFVHDRQTGETTLVSVDSDGVQSDYLGSYWASISANGRFVALVSDAPLVDGDSNGFADIFVRDRQTGETTLVSVSSDGQQGNGFSYWSSISADGRYVVFESYASTLVSGDTNGAGDVFVHDRQTVQSPSQLLDIDGDGDLDALTDGLLVLRYLFGFTGEPLTSGAMSSTASRTGDEIFGQLNTIRPMLDVDGDGQVDALTDGLLILRYLFGFTGEPLTSGAIGPGAQRTTPEEIVGYLDAL